MKTPSPLHQNRFFSHLGGVCLLLLVMMVGCSTPLRILKYNIPGVKDYKIFPARKVEAADYTRPLPVSMEELPPIESWGMGKHYIPGQSIDEFFDKSGTIAFLVIRDDTLRYEWYPSGMNDTTTFTSFSMAKAYVSTLVGIAIDEGFIKNVDEPIGNYLPYCTDSAFCNLKIVNLLQMTSGLKTSESFANPFSTTSKLYYTKDLSKITHKLKTDSQPGDDFEYLNLNTQLLAEVLQNATQRTLAEYFEEKIWQPMGAEAAATWSLDDENGQEKAFCCVNARARDYARFGLLMLDWGKINGKQIVSKEWLKRATAADTSYGAPQNYQYHWYTTAEQNDFYGEGLFGQFTYMSPSTNTVIVRLGKKVQRGQQWYDMFKVLAGLTEKPIEVEIPRKTLESYEGTYTFGLSNIGDTSMVGRKVTLKRKGNGLLVKSKFNKDFVITPESATSFFYIRSGRRMEFQFDEQGEVEKIWWWRRGNSWWVYKDNPASSPIGED